MLVCVKPRLSVVSANVSILSVIQSEVGVRQSHTEIGSNQNG